MTPVKHKREESLKTLLITVSTLLFCVSSAWAQAGRLEDAPETRNYFDNYTTHLFPTADGIGLTAVELLGPDGRSMEGAEPMVFAHGFTQNSNAWHAAAEEARKQGFRVLIFNWRGHGQGPMRSVGLDGQSPETDSRMVFDNLPAYDVPAIVDFAYKLSGGMKVIYVGHSMGGMMMHLALGGVSRNENGEMTISAAHRSNLQSKLKAFVAVGSPVNFAALNGHAATMFEMMVSLRGLHLDHSGTAGLRALPFMNLAHQSRLDYTYNMGQFFNPLGGVINLRNMTREQYGIKREYTGSNVPAIFIQSVAFPRLGYFSADHKIDYAKISMGEAGKKESETGVPTLLVSAEHDTLAPWTEQAKAARNRGFGHYAFSETSHTDVILGKTAPELAARVKQFVRAAERLQCAEVFGSR